MQDPFFSKTNCDRCSNDLSTRTMSWFNLQTICMECARKEKAIKEKIRESGKNPEDYEGCGYIPKF